MEGSDGLAAQHRHHGQQTITACPGPMALSDSRRACSQRRLRFRTEDLDAFIATVLVRSQGAGSVVTDLEREVVEERRAQGLPPRITNPLILRRVASLITAPTPMSTNSGMAPERAAGRADQQAS